MKSNRINREIKAARVRVIDEDENQLGILNLFDALSRAEQAGLDLVEISANADPPVCKIVDFGKYRFQQGKKDKENKKNQHQVRVKEIKIKPNTEDNDIQTKLRQARIFIAQGDKVKISCVFRGREMLHKEFGFRAIKRICESLADIAQPDGEPSFFGRILVVTLSPGVKKKNQEGLSYAKKQNT